MKRTHDFPTGPAIAAHLVAGSTLLFAFGEQVLGDVFVDSAYLSSNLFYIPEILLGAGVALALHLAVCVAWSLIGRWRSRIGALAAMAASSLPVTAYLFVVAYPSPPLSMISWAYGGRIRGQALTVFLIWLTVFAGLVLIQQLVRSDARAGTGRRWLTRGRLAAAGVAAVVAALTFRPLYASYAALNLAMIWALALPLLVGLGLYGWVKGKSEAGLMRGARGWFALGVAVAFVSLARQYGPDSRGWIFLFLVAALTAAAWFFLRRGKGRIAGALSAAVPALLLCLLPVAELSWRAWSVWSSEPGEHVLLISVDTLRRDALSIYNPEAPATPNTDAMLSDGVLFSHAWSPSSWTLPALVSIQTGVPPLVHRTNEVDSQLSGEWETLAERFRERGYATEAIVYNPLLIPERGMKQGFDRYWYFPEFGRTTNLGQRLAKKLWLDRFEPSGSVSSMTTLAVLRLLRNRERPYFLWLHLFDPHPPYFPPARHWPESVPLKNDFTPPSRYSNPSLERQAATRDVYLAEVQYLDEGMGMLRGTLRAAGLYENMTVVFTSDHGEEFWEKGRWGHGNPPTETQVRVPLLFKPPGGAPGATSDRTTSTAEIMPMLLALLQGSPQEAYDVSRDARALLADFPRPAGSPEGLFSISLIHPKFHTEAIVFGEAPWKYMISPVSDEEELYDLGADPAEKRSLVEAAPEKLRRGRELYAAHQAWGEEEGARIESGPEMELSPEIVDQLKAHGYLE